MLKNLISLKQQQVKIGRVLSADKEGYSVSVGKSIVNIQTVENLEKGQIIVMAAVEGSYIFLARKGQMTTEIKRIYIDE